MSIAMAGTSPGLPPASRPDFEKLLKSDIEFRRINDVNDPAMQGFIDLYADAYARPPYKESFTRQVVEERVWVPHIQHTVLVAESKGQIVGLACAHPITQMGISAATVDFLKSKNQLFLNENRTMLISELAVSKEFEGMGIASALFISLLLSNVPRGCNTYAARIPDDHDVARRIFGRFGAQTMGEVQQDVNEVEGGGIATESHRRLYVGGKFPDLSKESVSLRPKLIPALFEALFDTGPIPIVLPKIERLVGSKRQGS